MSQRVRIANGLLSAEVMEYGAVLADLRIDGVNHGLTLSHPTLDAYQADPAHMGAIPGPVAGRISGGRFSIDSMEYLTTPNEGANTLHGGPAGFGRRNWQLAEQAPDFAEFRLRWPDGEGGFPGPINVTCRYQINDAALTITLEATTARPTICNLTQHSYFNLAGAGRIDDHVLEIASDRMTPFGSDLLPTGAIDPVPTALNFTDPRRIGETVLDHHYVLSEQRREATFAARLSTESLSMTVKTTEPGLVVYTADKLSSGPHGTRQGICLEPQFWPDAINHASFPSIILRPGDRYHQETTHTFAML